MSTSGPEKGAWLRAGPRVSAARGRSFPTPLEPSMSEAGVGSPLTLADMGPRGGRALYLQLTGRPRGGLQALAEAESLYC